MRLTPEAKKPETKSQVTSGVALVLLEIPADGMLAEEPATGRIHGEPRRSAGLLARSGRALRLVGRKLNPVPPTRIALGASGRAAKSVVINLHPRRLARAAREFQRIGTTDLARVAGGVRRGARGATSRIRITSPRQARSVRVIATTVRKLVCNIEPRTAPRMARQATRWAQNTLAGLDPGKVEEAVRRFVESVDPSGNGGRGKPFGTRWFDRVAKATVVRIGAEGAVRIAGEAIRALQRLIKKADPDHVGRVIEDLVRTARAANDRKGRLQVVGFLKSLVDEVGQALRSVAKEVQPKDVVVVILIVLATAPELLVAAGMSVAAVRALTLLAQALVHAFPGRTGSHE